MINKSNKNKNLEYERKGHGLVCEDATAKNVNEHTNNDETMRVLKNIRLQEHSSDCLCGLATCSKNSVSLV